MASPARSPVPAIRSPPSPEAPKENALRRLLITPMLFLSFLLSLALVDSQNHRLRTKTHWHSPSRSQPTTLLGHVRNFLHGLVWKEVDAGPYAYVRSPNLTVGEGQRERSASASSSPSRRSGENDEPWHWHTKQRKMMRAEVEDAFKVRKWVVVFLVLMAVNGIGLLAVMGWWMVGFWRNREGGVSGRRDL
ncbi:hypothetical protein BKA65DRAFT_490492 [Rhexocercosporidium sp. MPI-PUGE-AT-0058]|nr:hypothetical protein BKA65DRAFT_490492 [Rhexocercosporidium sp. MPI-PUGE-AT-0058]